MNMWIERIAVANILRLGGRGNTNSRINSLDVRKKYKIFQLLLTVLNLLEMIEKNIIQFKSQIIQNWMEKKLKIK